MRERVAVSSACAQRRQELALRLSSWLSTYTISTLSAMSSWTGLGRGILSSASWRRQLLRKPLAANCRRTESTTTAAAPAYRAKKDSLLSPTMILLGIVPIFTFALGTWQVKRLKWKINLIDELQEKLARDPMPLPRKLK